jgi:hypothetical protein
METWLCNEDVVAAQRFAVLIDFVPVATGAAVAGYSVGDRFAAELVLYPSAMAVAGADCERFERGAGNFRTAAGRRARIGRGVCGL